MTDFQYLLNDTLQELTFCILRHCTNSVKIVTLYKNVFSQFSITLICKNILVMSLWHVYPIDFQYFTTLHKLWVWRPLQFLVPNDASVSHDTACTNRVILVELQYKPNFE